MYLDSSGRLQVVKSRRRDRAAAMKEFVPGFRAFMGGKFKSAKRRFQRAVAADYSFAAAWRLLGLACLRLGEKRAARRALRRFLRLAPTAPTAGQVRGILRTL